MGGNDYINTLQAMGGQRTTRDDWIITSDDWLPEYQEDCPETPEFPSGPAPFLGDGTFDAPIPSMNPSLRLPVSYDTYLKRDAESMSLDYIFNYYNLDNDSIYFPQQAVEVDALEVSNDCESISERLRDMNLSTSCQGVQQVDLPDRKFLAPVVLFDGDSELVAHNESDKVYIDKPDDWDIVMGRENEGNHHPGNNRFQKIVSEKQLSKHIEKRVNNYGGHFPKKETQGCNFITAMDVVSDTEVIAHHESDTVYIVKPGEWDILADRGGGGNNHPGNKWFQKIVSRIKPVYQGTNTSRKAKTKLSKHIVERVKNYGGRFLEKDQVGYVIMKEEKTIKKTSQAL